MQKMRELLQNAGQYKKNNDRPQPYETLTWEVQSICQPQPYAADSQNLLHHREQEGQM